MFFVGNGLSLFRIGKYVYDVGFVLKIGVFDEDEIEDVVMRWKKEELYKKFVKKFGYLDSMLYMKRCNGVLDSFILGLEGDDVEGEDEVEEDELLLIKGKKKGVKIGKFMFMEI